jgi:heme-degrading monooxygenase HmoA
MTVRIIIKRRVPEEKKAEVVPLILQLRAMATSQPGYLFGETLVNADNLEEYIVLSSWNDLDSWRNWKLSNHRAEINEKIEAMLEEKTEYNAYFYGDIYLYNKSIEK